MKNIITIIFFFLFAISLSAQTDTVLRSKKGIPILPQAGDWAIGADAKPFFNYLGNAFNNSTSNDLDLGNETLYFRYFLKDNAAVRLLIGVDKSTTISRHFVQDDAAFFKDPLSNVQTEDKSTINSSKVNIDLGYQIFRGYGRLRGFYGPSINYVLSRYRTRYNYGNPMSALNTTPSSYYSYTNGARTLESDNGYTHSLGLGLIAGAEYYFAPKISIGLEVTARAYLSWKSEGNTKSEMWNGSKVVTMDKEDDPAGRTKSGIYTQQADNFSGSLYLMFHF